jgi:hypothetical protein
MKQKRSFSVNYGNSEVGDLSMDGAPLGSLLKREPQQQVLNSADVRLQ